MPVRIGTVTLKMCYAVARSNLAEQSERPRCLHRGLLSLLPFSSKSAFERLEIRYARHPNFET